MKKQIKKTIKRIIVDRTISRNSKWGSFWNYRHGFLQETVDVCGITKENYKDFLSDRKYRMSHPINGPYSSIIDNKLWLPFLLKDYLNYCPKYFYYKDNSGFLDLQTKQRVACSDLLAALKVYNKMACKHTHSSLGKGFFMLEFNDGVYYINNKNHTLEEIKVFLCGLNEYVFTEYIHQHSYVSRVSEDSLNTIRLLTVWDQREKEFKVVRGFQRFGCNHSLVDNLASGNGVLSYLDIDKGVLTGEGKIAIDGKTKIDSNVVHPDSKIQLKGMKIPNYNQIIKVVLSIANENSYLRYLGWDIGITESGFKVIEINSLTSLSTIQQEKGFLVDPILKTYFE